MLTIKLHCYSRATHVEVNGAVENPTVCGYNISQSIKRLIKITKK